MAFMQAHLGIVAAGDDRWVPRPYPRSDLAHATLAGGMAGEVSHPLDNVLWKIERLCQGDPDLQFGLSDVACLEPHRVLELVSDATGYVPPREARTGAVSVDPHRVLDTCEAVGDRLAEACRRGERVILATGHPTGLTLLYLEVGRLLQRRGVELLRPLDGVVWTGGKRHTRRSVRYFHGVAVLTTHGSAVHTHSPEPMERMLRETRPDLVFADHGFAGAAIDAGIETLSIADVNDPALLVAKAVGLTDTVVVMDDNVRPEAYWPCFQAVAARLP